MRKIFVLWLLFITGTTVALAQSTDSSRTRISLLTCTAGAELYSSFGHSALRVIDSNAVTDIVFNYGTFDFSDPDFYSKFVGGKLNYYLSAEYFNDFTYSYQQEGRGITEQVLMLSQTEKIAIKNALRENLQEANRFYAYDFFLDNCTTRLRDLILRIKTPAPELPYTMPNDYSFRNAIHDCLDQQNHHWSKLGIDLLLGAPTDATMTSAQQQFLPDNLMLALDASNPPIVISSENILPSASFSSKGIQFTPLLIFSVVLGLLLLLSLVKHKYVSKTLNALDFILFFITGLLGVLFVLMWVATDHSMTKENYNLLWALPTHGLFAFLLNSRQKIVKKYFLVSAIIGICTLVAWPFLPQQLNISLIPIVVLLAFRSIVQYKKK